MQIETNFIRVETQDVLPSDEVTTDLVPDNNTQPAPKGPFKKKEPPNYLKCSKMLNPTKEKPSNDKKNAPYKQELTKCQPLLKSQRIQNQIPQINLERQINFPKLT